MKGGLFWKEPGLFTDYHDAELEGGDSVTIEKNGSVEFTSESRWGEGDRYIWLTLEELERLAKAARALKEYTKAEQERVDRLNQEVMR